MAYILRTHLKKKYFFHGLQSVFGVGASHATSLCHRLGYNPKFLLKNLTSEQIYHVGELVQDLKFPIKGDLQRIVYGHINDLISRRTYRGFRHRQGLPCRGQRCHTNARTQKKLKFSRKLK